MGSISDNRSGGYWDYRISKAALNMVARNMAIELGNSGIVTVVLSPGWVRTDMGGPGAPHSPEEAVTDLIRTIDTLGAEQNGGFFDRAGKPLPW
jgi:NAD(P)-dependent dehydrogenase (short-subunit alcohol dehydrogenase family)